MGDPKKPKKKYKTPRHPWRLDQLQQEINLVGEYGLRNKKELWKADTMLSKIRRQARSLLAAPPEIRARQQGLLLNMLVRMGLLNEGSTLDDVLSLRVENILERRLQTLVWRKGLAKTVYQARQMIVHGHIMVGDRVVDRPGYLVTRDEEETIRIRPDSPFAKQEAS